MPATYRHKKPREGVRSLLSNDTKVNTLITRGGTPSVDEKKVPNFQPSLHEEPKNSWSPISKQKPANAYADTATVEPTIVRTNVNAPVDFANQPAGIQTQQPAVAMATPQSISTTAKVIAGIVVIGGGIATAFILKS